MRIGIDVSPLKTAHRFRGIGAYTENLIKALEKYNQQDKYNFFTQGQNLPKNIDLAHYPYFEPFFLTLPLRKKIPTVVTVHDLIPLVFPHHFPPGLKGKIKWQIQKWSLRRVGAIIVDSQCSQRDVAKVTGVPAEKIFVIYLAAGEEFQPLQDGKDLKKIRNKYQLPEKFVLYVGDATWNKNVPGLVKAVQKINVPLVLVGKPWVDSHFDRANPWNKDLVEVEKLTQGDKRIYKLGFVPQNDLVVLYNLATLYAQPSFYEGFGLPVLEAMSCGCPVVTSKTGSLPEVAGEAALYVDPQDIDDLASGIGEIFFNSQVREKFRQKGLLQAKKFSWKKTTYQTVKVYQQMWPKIKNETNKISHL